MIELQMLNYVLENRSFLFLSHNNIQAQDFVSYASEANFIYNHYNKYGTIPDKETFLDKFIDFDIIQVRESEDYLLDTFREQTLYNKLVPMVNKISQLVAEDSNTAVEFARNAIETLVKETAVSGKGYDIIANAKDRGNEYKKRAEREGLMGITTGIKELDDVTNGWLPGEELIVILGRTNEGKSWVLLFFLVAAWLAGHDVFLYSGEMSKETVGFRFDTLVEHFNHSSLTSGGADLGEGRKASDYISYVDNLSKSTDKPKFVVVTPKDLGGRPDVPTLQSLVEQYDPDIVGVDQISLMEDSRSVPGTPERLRYTHIAEDLYLMSEKLRKPVLSPSQANRESAKKKDDIDDTPDMHEISESDGVGHNATRVIAMRQIDSTLKLKVRKSRYSKKGSEVLMLWDIEKGIIKPFGTVQPEHQSTDTSSSDIQFSESPTLDGSEMF